MLVEGKPAELTGLTDVTPPGTRRVLAECEQGAAALMGKARSMEYVQDVTIFGNALHLLVDAGVDDRRLERELTAAAGSPVHVRPIGASLEDVFVRLTRLQQQGTNHDGKGARHEEEKR
jgi:hypothetical protein